MAKTRTGKKINADFIELSDILNGIAKFEDAPLKQMQYIAKELPEFIEKIWQAGHTEGEIDGELKAKIKGFNVN